MNKANPYITKMFNDLELDIDVKYRLSQHLLRTEDGINDILLTPIAKEISPDVILSRFDKVFDENRSKINSVLLDLELSNKAKFGPRSIAKPWSERAISFLDSFGLGSVDISSYKITPLSSISNLRPLSLAKSILLLKNGTNSGLPYFTQKYKVKERVLNKFRSLLDRKDPCILFTRTQEQKKTRNVWGYPIADTLNEMMFYSPTLKFQKELKYRCAIVSPEKVSTAVTLLINRCAVRDSKYVMISIDFKTYDETVKKELQALAFSYIKSLFQKQYSKYLDLIFERFNTIGIITPSGLISGPHGIPSGSTFTNEVGSIVQATIALNSGIVSVDDFQVQGDDGVYLLESSQVDGFLNHFERLGLKINRDKSYTSKYYCIYLQNLYHSDYQDNGLIGGIYPVYRALLRILFQERWSTFEDYGIEGKDYYSIRTLCILENCKYHPLFQELVSFIYKLDKYSLDFKDQSLSRYIQMMKETQGAGEILRHQFGDDVSGIKSFQSYKIVKELSN